MTLRMVLALVLRAAVLEALELVTAGAERRARRVPDRAHLGVGERAGVDEVFAQRAEDAVARGIDAADAPALSARRQDHRRGRGID